MQVLSYVSEASLSELRSLYPMKAWEAYREGRLPEKEVFTRPGLRPIGKTNIYARADGKFVRFDGPLEVVLRTSTDEEGNVFHEGQDATYSLAHEIFVNFIGPVPQGYRVGHVDGDRSNSAIDNLMLEPVIDDVTADDRPLRLDYRHTRVEIRQRTLPPES